jgi:hypothetical protein
MATTNVHSLNTISALVCHINYFVRAALKVLQGDLLKAQAKYSFDHPPLLSQQDSEKLLNKTRTDVENFASLIEKLPELKL